MEPIPPVVEPDPPKVGLYTPVTGAQQWRGPLAGHALQARGEAFLATDCERGRCATNLRGTVHQENGADGSVSGAGHGLCECEALSPHVDTGVARRMWHREHKARIHLGLPEPDRG